MKLIKLAIIGSLALISLNSEVLAQVNSAGFSLNQANQALSLEEQEFETIYRTDQVPDTCYRDEVQGTRQECRTDYDRRCHLESYPSCTNVPRRSCIPRTECTTRMDRVCNSHGCTNVPRRSCQTVNQCSTDYDRVCRTETRQVCQNYPRQVCYNVPNVVRVPYACTRPVQVPAGQRLKLKTIAQVSVQFASLADVGPTADVLTATLKNGQVSITAPVQASFLYQIVSQQRSEQMISATEKLVTYSVSISAVSIQKLNEFLSSQIINPVLFKNRIEFTLAGKLDVPIKGHLQIGKTRRVRAPIGIIDSDFANRAIVTQGATSTLMLSPFGVNVLESQNHRVSIKLSLDLQVLQQGLINPQALGQISNRSVDSQFDSIPR